MPTEMNSTDFLNTIENLCTENGKLQAIIESSTIGIIEINNEGVLVSANPSFYQMLSIHPRDKTAGNVAEIFSSEELKEDLKTLLTGPNEIMVKGFHVRGGINHSGKMKYLEIKFSRVPVKDRMFIIGMVKDKTDILRALKNREEYISSLLNIIRELKVDNRDTVYHIASLVELRDNTTGDHLKRVESYTRKLGYQYMYAFRDRDKRLTESFVEDMAVSSVLHDIGKVGISDTILLKPGKLTEGEYKSIKEHTIIAGEALKEFKGKKDILAMGREIATSHHEKWNGTGYPGKLKEYEIPLSARIVALCDTYDALTTRRPYKEPFSHEKAVEIITEERGISFDPDIVDLFLRIHHEFNDIRVRYED